MFCGSCLDLMKWLLPSQFNDCVYSVENIQSNRTTARPCGPHDEESGPLVHLCSLTECPVASISIIDDRKVLPATLNNGTCQLRGSPFRHPGALLRVGRGESPTSLRHYSSRKRTYPRLLTHSVILSSLNPLDPRWHFTKGLPSHTHI